MFFDAHELRDLALILWALVGRQEHRQLARFPAGVARLSRLVAKADDRPAAGARGPPVGPVLFVLVEIAPPQWPQVSRPRSS